MKRSIEQGPQRLVRPTEDEIEYLIMQYPTYGKLLREIYYQESFIWSPFIPLGNEEFDKAEVMGVKACFKLNGDRKAAWILPNDLLSEEDMLKAEARLERLPIDSEMLGFALPQIPSLVGPYRGMADAAMDVACDVANPNHPVAIRVGHRVHHEIGTLPYQPKAVGHQYALLRLKARSLHRL